MPRFSNAPPKDPRGYGLDLIRTPANGKLVLAITSHEIIGCPTHWYGGRTIPCEEIDCPACLEAVPWRWHGYLSGILPKPRHHVIYEFTAQAAEQITAYANTHPTMRNAILTARRHLNRRNGRVIIEITTGDPEKLHLPDQPNMIQCLSIIWNIPQPDIKRDGRMKDNQQIRIHTGGNHEKIANAIAAKQAGR